MKLFIADIGQGTVHIFDSVNDIFYPKQPLEILKNLEQEESTLAKSLSDKYGNGTLDLDTGKITLVEA